MLCWFMISIEVVERSPIPASAPRMLPSFSPYGARGKSRKSSERRWVAAMPANSIITLADWQ